MSALPYSPAVLAQEAADFAAKITPCRERWEYCLDRASYVYMNRYYGEMVGLHQRTLPVCDRILGVYPGCAQHRLAKLAALGFDGAEEWAKSRPVLSGVPFFKVGPMEAWHVGHVYFARLKSHPHVVKIGFSRRVRERLDDIESKCGSLIFVEPGELRVGTLADEHWWHHNWRATRISGEWFFDPFTMDRTLPAFLDRKPAMEAA